MAFPPDVYIGNGDEDSRFLNIYANPHMSISSTIRRSLMHNADEKAELFSVHKLMRQGIFLWPEYRLQSNSRTLPGQSSSFFRPEPRPIRSTSRPPSRLSI